MLSGVEAFASTGVNVERGGLYLVRLLRVFDVLAEYGIASPRRCLEGGGAVHEESFVRGLLETGWAACGCAAEY